MCLCYPLPSTVSIIFNLFWALCKLIKLIGPQQAPAAIKLGELSLFELIKHIVNHDVTGLWLWGILPYVDRVSERIVMFVLTLSMIQFLADTLSLWVGTGNLALG